MSYHELDRRRFIGVTTTALSTALIAGCLGDDSGEETGGENGAGDGSDSDEGDDDGGGDDTDFVEDEPDYGGWFDDVDNYEGTVDMTGQSEVTVLNGAGDNGLDYDPAAILVDTGTTVVWEWTGDGGGHTVTDEDGAFESENSAEAGFTFEHTFDEPGVYQYYCQPHRGVGQKGAVVVE